MLRPELPRQAVVPARSARLQRDALEPEPKRLVVNPHGHLVRHQREAQDRTQQLSVGQRPARAGERRDQRRRLRDLLLDHDAQPLARRWQRKR